jgi:NAD(P)-dependent dehydrogenase (short-subunit alcohol dehydrogenase family)
MKIAVVTGASSGIGKAIVDTLLQQNWKVYGLSRSNPDYVSDNFVWIESDLSKIDNIESALVNITETKIDLLVSNAGVFLEELATSVSPMSYERIFNVNVLAPMLLVSNLANKLKKATIISVSSVSDRLIEKEYALYCSSKAANTRYFEAVADELKEARVFTLLPDYVDTPMLRTGVGESEFDWASTIKAEDLASFAVDLAQGKTKLESASNIIIVTNGLIEDLESREKLYGFNTDTKELIKL